MLCFKSYACRSVFVKNKRCVCLRAGRLNSVRVFHPGLDLHVLSKDPPVTACSNYRQRDDSAAPSQQLHSDSVTITGNYSTHSTYTRRDKTYAVQAYYTTVRNCTSRRKRGSSRVKLPGKLYTPCLEVDKVSVSAAVSVYWCKANRISITILLYERNHATCTLWLFYKRIL